MKIVFFAQLREQLKTESLEVAATQASSLQELKDYLVELHPEWKEFLANPSLLTAVNHRYVKTHEAEGCKLVLNEPDEIAFFPPVTGG